MSETVGPVFTVTSSRLVGVWVFDPTDPDGSDINFMHADGRVESIKPESATIRLAGKRNPLIEFGEATVVVLTLTVFIPFGPTHDAGVQWWRDAAEARRTLCYRDNRGRLYYVAMPDGVAPADGRAGTALQLKMQRVDFDEAVE